MKPKYQHDCDDCVYLGLYIDGSGTYDLYFCVQGGKMPTVIARWGDEPSHNMSGLGLVLTPLKVAVNRAIQRGLLKRVNDRVVLV